MKRLYKILIGFIILGIVTGVIGVIILVAEISTFRYMGNKNYEANYDEFIEKVVKMPNNSKEIYYEKDENINVVVDNSIQPGVFKLRINYDSSKCSNVDGNVFIDENAYLTNYRVHNNSSNLVNELDIDVNYVSFNFNILSRFKEILGDFKERKIYNYNDDSGISYTIITNESDYIRFLEVPYGYDLEDIY